MKMTKRKWRIVPDNFLGYEVQHKNWYWPFWVMHKANTHKTKESARVYIKQWNTNEVVDAESL